MILSASSFRWGRPLLLLAVLLLASPLRAAEWGGYTSSADAARAAKGADAKIGYADEAIQRLSGYLVKRRHEAALAAIDRGDFAKIDKEVAETNKKLAALKAERRTAIAEMIQGLFCSGCNRTRSDILSKGEQFPHPGQKIIKATQAQINAKVAEFDRREAALKNQLKSLADRRKTATVRWRQRLIDTQAAVTRTGDALTNARNARSSAVMDAAIAHTAVAMLEMQERQEAAEREQQRIADLQRRQQAELAARIRREIAANATDLEQKRIAAEEMQREEEEERKKALARAAEIAAQTADEQKEKIRRVTEQEVQRMREALTRWGINPDAPSAPTPVEVEKAYSFQEELSNKLRGVAQVFTPSATPPPGPPDAAPALRQLSETEPASADTNESKVRQYLQKTKEYLVEHKGVVKEKLVELGVKMAESAAPEETVKPFGTEAKDMYRKALDFSDPADPKAPSPKGWSAVRLGLYDKLKNFVADKLEKTGREKAMETVYEQTYGPINSGDKQLDDAERKFWSEAMPTNIHYRTGYFSREGLKNTLKDLNKKFFDYFNLATDKISNDAANDDPDRP